MHAQRDRDVRGLAERRVLRRVVALAKVVHAVSVPVVVVVPREQRARQPGGADDGHGAGWDGSSRGAGKGREGTARKGARSQSSESADGCGEKTHRYRTTTCIDVGGS